VERGSVVVVYTDGVSEAENSERDQFGLERLSSVVSTQKDNSATDIHGGIRAALSEFVGDHSASDDSTMIVLKF
jgi:sigma-B regulation protein RsbU (phosphoserine phosphatase)